MPNDIISTPLHNQYETSGQDNDFAFYETIGNRRPSQEDALVYLDLKNKPKLTPEQAGQRLWSTHKKLDAMATPAVVDESGATATSVYYDGKNHIVTATLADTSSFAVVYGVNQSVIKVVRLNSVTHTGFNQKERERVRRLGGSIFWNRFLGVKHDNDIAVSRAIGDHDFVGLNECPLLAANSHLDKTSVDALLSDCKEDAVSIEIISTCDGFTDGAGREKQSKKDHELYLKQCLEKEEIRHLKGKEKYKKLAQMAMEDGSTDNISIAGRIIYKAGKKLKKAFFLGVYDGHSGNETAILVATNIGDIFREHCALDEKAYAQSEYSVHRYWDVFVEDNPEFVSQDLTKKKPDNQTTETDNQIGTKASHDNKASLERPSWLDINVEPTTLTTSKAKLIEEYTKQCELYLNERYFSSLLVYAYLGSLVWLFSKQRYDKIASVKAFKQELDKIQAQALQPDEDAVNAIEKAYNDHINLTKAFYGNDKKTQFNRFFTAAPDNKLEIDSRHLVEPKL